ncbi:MAG: 4Fe-4S binding protein [Promethearchaeia archaeon]
MIRNPDNTQENSCCCSTPNAGNIIGTLDIRIFINPSKCIGCGLCEELCPFELPKDDGKGKYYVETPENCTECSACQRNCPVDAIILQEQKGCGCLWDAKQKIKEKNSISKCC